MNLASVSSTFAFSNSRSTMRRITFAASQPRIRMTMAPRTSRPYFAISSLIDSMTVLPLATTVCAAVAVLTATSTLVAAIDSLLPVYPCQTP